MRADYHRTSGYRLRRLAVLLGLALLAVTGAPAASESVEDAGFVPREIPPRWTGTYVDEPTFGSRMFVLEAGVADGPVLLLVHGLGQNGLQDWWEVIEALEDEYRIIAMDLPGFGRSDVPRGELSPARYSRMLAWLSEHMSLQDMHIVGHSMGGAIVLYHASEYPRRIDNVVLVNAAGVLHRAAFLRGSVTASWDASGIPGRIGDHARRLINWGSSFVERIGMLPDILDLLRSSDQAWNALLADRPNTNAALSLLDTDFSTAIARLEHSASSIWGAQDTVAPLRTGNLLHGRLGGGRLEVIEGAAHVPMKSHTGEFMRYLRRSLEQPPTGGRELRAVEQTARDFTCRDGGGRTISGAYRHIAIHNCTQMRLVDVSAHSLNITRSIVEMIHVNVQAEGVAAEIDGATVIATDVRLYGNPALDVSRSRVDIAGGSLRSPGEALRVGPQKSTIIFSVSDMHSGIYRGPLHGAVSAADIALDGASQIHGKR